LSSARVSTSVAQASPARRQLCALSETRAMSAAPSRAKLSAVLNTMAASPGSTLVSSAMRPTQPSITVAPRAISTADRICTSLALRFIASSSLHGPVARFTLKATGQACF